MLLSDIRQRFRDRVTNTTYTDEELDRLIAAAVRFYSRHAPRVLETTINTVNGQQDYTLPEDVWLVTDVEWWPFGKPVTTEVTSPAIYTENVQKYISHAPADRLIDNINRMGAEDTLRGEWEQRNHTTLRLYPTPEANDLAVKVTYTVEHALNAGSTGYDTIPDVHLEPLVDLVIAEHLLAQAVNRVNEPDYTAGFSKVSKAHLPAALRREANTLRAGAVAAIKVL